MALIELPYPEQLRAEHEHEYHIAGCRTCRAFGRRSPCGPGGTLHEQAILAAHDAHAKALARGDQVVMRRPPARDPLEVWRLLLADLQAGGGPAVLEGRDVSKWQSSYDWAAAAVAGVVFGFAKATEGVGYVDPTFAANWSGMLNAGRVPGAYHFCRPDLGNTGDAEAAFFASVVGNAAGALLAQDAESAGGSAVWCQAFHDRLAAAYGGYSAAFYSYLNWLTSRGVGSGAGWLWLAWPDSGPLPATSWPVVSMQQYGTDAAGVDADRFFGTLDQLRALTVGAPSPGGDVLQTILATSNDPANPRGIYVVQNAEQLPDGRWFLGGPKRYVPDDATSGVVQRFKPLTPVDPFLLDRCLQEEDYTTATFPKADPVAAAAMLAALKAELDATKAELDQLQAGGVIDLVPVTSRLDAAAAAQAALAKHLGVGTA